MKHIKRFGDGGLISESRADDYKQSAPRAKQIAKIARSLGPKEVASGPARRRGAGTGEVQAAAPADHSPLFGRVDEFFGRFQQYERSVDVRGVEVGETYYHTDSAVYMKISRFGGRRGDQMFINSVKFAELRKHLGVTARECLEVLKARYGVSEVIKNNPYETASDIRMFKSPPPPKAPRPTTPSLPYEQILASLVDRYGLKTVEFTRVANKKPTRYLAYYMPGDEMFAIVINSDKQWSRFMIMEEDFYMELSDMLEEDYMLTEYDSRRLAMNRIFGVTGVNPLGKTHRVFDGLSRKMRWEIALGRRAR